MTSMWVSLLIFVGAGCGGVARYWVALHVDKLWQAHLWGLPIGTMLVNVIGSACIGAIARWDDQPWIKFLILVGFLGGFTTFSSFSLQTMQLFEKGHMGLAFVHVIVSVILCCCGAAAGMWLMGKFS